VQSLQLRVGLAGVVAEQVAQSALQRAACAVAGGDLAAFAAAGQMCQSVPSGRVQVAQSGSVRLPPRTGRMFPQPMQRARRCRQARHHGCPVSLETTPGPVRPQIVHVIVVAGVQPGHRGPPGVRVLTGR